MYLLSIDHMRLLQWLGDGVAGLEVVNTLVQATTNGARAWSRIRRVQRSRQQLVAADAPGTSDPRCGAERAQASPVPSGAASSECVLMIERVVDGLAQRTVDPPV